MKTIIRNIAECRDVEIEYFILMNQAKKMGCEKLDKESVIDFFYENEENLERVYIDICEISQSGRNQSVNYGEYNGWGQITDWSEKGWFMHTSFCAFDEKGAYCVELYDWCPTYDYDEDGNYVEINVDNATELETGWRK